LPLEDLAMRFLLDTCVLSDFARGDRSTLEHIKEFSPDDLAISTVTEMEIDYGLRLNQRLARRLKPVMDAFLESVHLLPYDRAAAKATADFRAVLKQTGGHIGAYDVLIAGTALAQGLILVTSNVREFSRVSTLRVEDWRR
jgi:tRNA(fMet)-specific endonuclease VapC